MNLQLISFIVCAMKKLSLIQPNKNIYCTLSCFKSQNKRWDNRPAGYCGCMVMFRFNFCRYNTIIMRLMMIAENPPSIASLV